MANSTLTIIPSDVTDPTLLCRALNSIIEAVDTLRGTRGVEAEDASAALNAIVDRAEAIQATLLETIQVLEDKLAQESAKSISDLEQELDDLRVKLTQVPVLGFEATFTGNGSSNPSLGPKHNVNSAVRISTGRYRITLTSNSVLGRQILTNSVITASLSVNSTTMGKLTQVSVGSDYIEYLVEALAIDTDALVKAVYDIQASDSISVIGLLSPIS